MNNNNFNFNVMSYEEFQNLGPGWTMESDSYCSYNIEATKFLMRSVASTPEDFFEEIVFGSGRDVLSDLVPLLKVKLEYEAQYKTSDSWRKLRRALTVFYRSSGLESEAMYFKSIENPVDYLKRPKKPGRNLRQITVPNEDFDKIIENRRRLDDRVSESILIITRLLGLRPSEIPSLDIVDSDESEGHITIHITGAKKTKVGKENAAMQRGIDRTLTIPYRQEWLEAFKVCSELSRREVVNAQERLRKAAVKLWPKRKRRFCLYSLRYTLGSNLKNRLGHRQGGARTIAAIMGHKSTNSASGYGHSKSGKSMISIVPDDKTLSQVVEDRGYGSVISRLKPSSIQRGKHAGGVKNSKKCRVLKFER